MKNVKKNYCLKLSDCEHFVCNKNPNVLKKNMLLLTNAYFDIILSLSEQHKRLIFYVFMMTTSLIKYAFIRTNNVLKTFGFFLFLKEK